MRIKYPKHPDQGVLTKNTSKMKTYYCTALGAQAFGIPEGTMLRTSSKVVQPRYWMLITAKTLAA